MLAQRRERERERESRSTFVFSVAGDRYGRQIRRDRTPLKDSGGWPTAKREAAEREGDDRDDGWRRQIRPEREREVRRRQIRPQRDRERGAAGGVIRHNWERELLNLKALIEWESTNNYKNAIVKQNFRMISGNFASP
jgi:hypothetical protein